MCAMRISPCAAARPAEAASASPSTDFRNFMSCSLSKKTILCAARGLFGARLGLGPAPDGDRRVELLLLALELHLRRLPGRERGDEVEHRGGIGHRPALDLDQHVAGLHAGLVR